MRQQRDRGVPAPSACSCLGRVNLLSYVAPGDEHVVLGDGLFYTEEANGERLVDWVARLIDGEPVDDVHCRRCSGG